MAIAVQFGDEATRGRLVKIAAVTLAVLVIGGIGWGVRGILKSDAPPVQAAAKPEPPWEKLSPTERTRRELLHLVPAGPIHDAVKAERYHAAADLLSREVETELARGEGTLARANPALATLEEARGLTHILRESRAAAAAHFVAAAGYLEVAQQVKKAALLDRAADQRRQMGELAAALDLWRQARALLLATPSPEAPALLATCDTAIGDVLLEKGDVPGALASYGDALGRRETLAAGAPGDRKAQESLAALHDKIGAARVRQGDHAAAAEAFAAHLAITAPLAQEKEDLARVADHYDRLGDTLLSASDAVRAAEAFREGLAIRQSLAGGGSSVTVASSHLKVGEALMAVGETARALKHFERARADLQAATAPDRKRPDQAAKRALPGSHVKVAEALLATGDASGARKAAQAALDAIGDPREDKAARTDAALAHERVGDAVAAQGDPAGAAKSYRDAIAAREKAKAASGAEMARLRGKLGDVLLLQADAGGALAQFKASLADMPKAPFEAADPAALDSLADTHEKIADLFLRNGRPAGAAQSFRDALAVREALAARDAGLAAQRDRARLHTRIGDALAAQGDADGALAAYRQAVAFAQALADEPMAGTQARRELAAAHDRIGDVLLGRGDPEGARTAYGEALAIRSEAAARAPEDAEARIDQGTSHTKLLAAGGGPDHARALAAVIEDLKARGIGHALFEAVLGTYRAGN